MKRLENLDEQRKQGGYCGQIIKKAILHRKNALFYKTRRGALVGDMHMSLIYSCELCEASPLDYLTQLHLHADEVAEHPEDWMPWNYQAAREPADAQTAS